MKIESGVFMKYGNIPVSSFRRHNQETARNRVPNQENLAVQEVK